MNRDPDFESSADMRLLELQRTALGLSAPQRASWESRYAGDSTALGDDVAALHEGKSAVLTLSLTANPPAGVIPGTVVTYALSVINESGLPAHEVIAAVPLPAGVSYRLGSLALDGRAAGDESADALFGRGLTLGTIAPRSRATVLWKVGVRMGTKPLVVIPSVRARAAAVIGGAALLVDRKGNVGAFANELAAADRAIFEPKPLIPIEIPADLLPIYELDTEEEIVYEAADAALSDAAAPPPMAPEPKLAAEPIQPEPQSDPEPEPVAPAWIEPEPPAPVSREAVIFYGAFDRTTLAFFERVFNGSKDPAILQHCIFASALACAVDAEGRDTIGLKEHLAAQSQILHRVSLHEKLGKKEPIAEYAGRLIAQLEHIEPQPVVPPQQSNADRLILVNDVHEPGLAVIRKIAEERERWDFIKARQLTLALQGQHVVLADENRAAAIDNALRSYAQTAMTVLQKLFVRLRIDRTTGVLFQSDPALDAAARTLLAACAAALPA